MLAITRARHKFLARTFITHYFFTRVHYEPRSFLLREDSLSSNGRPINFAVAAIEMQTFLHVAGPRSTKPAARVLAILGSLFPGFDISLEIIIRNNIKIERVCDIDILIRWFQFFSFVFFIFFLTTGIRDHRLSWS